MRKFGEVIVQLSFDLDARTSRLGAEDIVELGRFTREPLQP